MSRQWIFVYGTLRPSGHNHRWLLPCMMQVDSRDVMVPGKLYHLEGCSEQRPGYPLAQVAVRAEEGISMHQTGMIHGTLIQVDTDVRDFDYVRSMELGAGYVERFVWTFVCSDGELVSLRRAVVWHYPYNDLGPEVPGGDWSRHLSR